MKKTNKLISILLVLAMLLSMAPIAVFTASAASAPSYSTTSEGVRLYANGTNLFIEAGTASGTAVYYMNGSTKTYVNPNGAKGNDLSNSEIYMGTASSNSDYFDVSLVMTGGEVGTIYTAKSYGYLIGKVTVAVTGTAKAGLIWCGSKYGPDNGMDLHGKNGNLAIFDTVGAEIRSGSTGFDGMIKNTESGWEISGNAVIPEGVTMTVASGQTVTVPADAAVENNGALVNNGTLELYGAVTGNSITGNGTINCYADYIENVSTVSSVSAKINGASVTLANGQYRLSGGKLYIWLPEGDAEVTLNSTKYYGIIVKNSPKELTAEYSGVTDISGIPSDITAYVVQALEPKTNTTTFVPEFTYEVLASGTTAADAKMTGTSLYASGAGTIKLKITASDAYTSYSETFTVTVKDAGYAADIANGDITISKYSDTQLKITHAGFDGGSLILDNDEHLMLTGTSGTDKNYGIVVENGATANILLKDCSIIRDGVNQPVMRISSGASVNLQLAGENVFTNSNSSHAGDEISNAGIHVPSGASLVIDGEGSLAVTGGENSAGIGGGTYEVSAGTITINGGTVTATGDQAAGIGGSYKGAGGTVTINGGTVTANGGTSSAGIGGGGSGAGGTVTVNGGTVTATGGSDGAGIGGGKSGAGGTVIISDGIVTAKGRGGSAGIGGGYKGAGATVTISGGTVTATGIDGAGIGGGGCAYASHGAAGDGGTVTISGGTVTATGTYGSGIGGGGVGDTTSKYDATAGAGGMITISGGTVVAQSTNSYGGAGIGSGGSRYGTGNSGGTVVITGGNIKATSNGGEAIGKGYNGTDSGTLKNADGNDLTLNTITLNGAAADTAVTKVEGINYGLTDVKTLDTDKLYFWLPADTAATAITAGENEYICNGNLTYYTAHSWANNDGTCTNGCGYECPHENQTGETCEICGAVLHTHSFTYSASGDTITAVCANTDGNCPDPEGTLTILAPADLYADGTTAKEATIENNLVDTSVAISYIIYSAPYGLPPKDAGTYTASVTVGGATATVEFTLLNYAAKVTDKDGNAVGNYKTFADAITAAQSSEGSTVTLLDDITLTAEQYVYSGKFTLDLNGKKIISENYNTLYILGNADFTINDSSEGGTIESKEQGYYAIYNYGTLTVESGVIKGDGGIDNIGTLIFKNGKIEADTYNAIRNSGTVYVYNGILESSNESALYNDTDSTLYVYDGEFSGNSAISNRGSAYIEGGEFTGNAVVALNLHGGTVEVTGGSFTGTDFSNGYYSGTPYGEWTVCYNEDATLILKGGEFPNGFVVDETTANTFLAEGYAFYDKDGYKITVADDATKIDGYVQVKEHFVASVTDKDGNAVGTYKTLADAITSASASEGSTITLLDDVNLTSMLEIASGKFILDLNGKTIINPDGIEIGSAAELTIVDSASGGKISGDMFGILNDGSLTVNGGVIKASCAVYNYGTITVDGGNIQGYITNNGALIVNDGILTRIKNPNTSYTATVEINGGTFTDFNTIENNDGDITVKGGIYPNGFSVTNDGNLEYTANSILADDYYYKDADGKLITVSDDAKVINGYVKVTKGADLSEAVITVDKTEFVYNGQHQAPAVTVTIGGKTLKENVDYAVNARRWENDVPVQWFYYVDAGVYTSVIIGLGDYTGTVKKEFVIKPATVDIIWEGDVFYYTGNPHKVTAKYVDVNGDEIDVASITNGENTEVGKYIATAVVEDSNYTVNGATINHAYEIKWYDGAPDATVSGTKGENGWYTSEVTVTAPEGYTISTAVDGTYGSEITFGNEENAVYYLKQTENGYIAKVELGEIKYDLANPAAEITMAENKWNSFFNTVTFGYFFKETQSITITASDETSGIAKIEYVVAAEEITDFENAEWIEYTEAFTIQPNSKNVIYAKATDNAGRYVIVNSDGIVVYSDSQAVTSEATYILTSMEDVEFEIDFNGNEVAYVMCGASYLDNAQYTATENGIKLHANYIEIAYTAGEYQFTVYVDPLGENFGYEGIGYDKYIEPHGDTPETITLTLTVKKLDGNVEITNDISKTYDGKAVSAPEYDIIGTGDVTVEYKVKGTDDSTYTTEAPVNAGEYTVRVYVAETGKSTAASATKDFTIAKKDVTVTATAPDKVYDGTNNLDLTEVTIIFDGIVDGDDVEYEILGGGFINANVGDNKMVGIAYGVGGDDAENYEFDNGSLLPIVQPNIVETTASIFAKDISDGVIILGDALTYNGTEQTQTVEKVLTTNNLEATFDISGNKATNVGVYLLTVTGTGNFTGEAKFAFEIALDDDCISHLDRVEDNGVMKWNVKSTDRESLEYIVDQLNDAVTDIADADKKSEWADIKEACEDMLRIINSIELFIADVEEDYAEFDIETVKSSDVPALDKLVSKVNEIKDRYGFNLTDEEEKKLEDILDGIEKLKAKIDETADEIARIDEAVNGYDKETVKSSDVPELGKLIEDIKALTDGDNLTEDEKAALEETEKAIDDLVEKLAEVAEEIKKVDEAVKSYDEETVKSTDSEDLTQLKEDIQNLIDSDNTTENEKTALEEMIKDIEGLEDKITETEEKLEEIKDIENNYNPENISSDDKAAIEDKIAEIEAVNPDNLTDEQKAEYEEIKAGFEALLEEIAAAEKNVADIGIELEKFDEERITKFWEDDIEALKAKIDELLADENMGETEKAKLNEHKAQCDNLIEIINTPKEYFSLRFFYLIWDCLTWKYNGILWLFSKIFG